MKPKYKVGDRVIVSYCSIDKLTMEEMRLIGKVATIKKMFFDPYKVLYYGLSVDGMYMEGSTYYIDKYFKEIQHSTSGRYSYDCDKCIFHSPFGCSPIRDIDCETAMRISAKVRKSNHSCDKHITFNFG